MFDKIRQKKIWVRSWRGEMRFEVLSFSSPEGGGKLRKKRPIVVRKTSKFSRITIEMMRSRKELNLPS